MMLSPGILTDDHLNQAVELVLEFPDMFVGPDRNVGFIDWVKHKINMEDLVLVNLWYQWTSFFEKEHILPQKCKR